MASKRRLRTLPGGGRTLSPSPDISRRYAEYASLVSRATQVFGSEIEATRWLSNASPDFDGRTPLQILAEEGAERPIAVLGRIEHGVYF